MKNQLDSAVIFSGKRLRHLTDTAQKILVATLACMFFTANAQQINYDVVSHFTNDNGLPQNSINAMQQDANGFVWMTTFDGLVRFDGNQLRIYNTGNTPAMRYNSLFGLSLNKNLLQIAPAYYDGTLLTIKDSKTVVRQNLPANAVYAWYNSSGITNFGNHFPGFLRKMDLFSEAAQKKAQAAGEWWNVLAQQDRQDGYYFAVATGQLWYYNGDRGNLCYENKVLLSEFILKGSTLYTYKKGTGLFGWKNGRPIEGIKGNFTKLLSNFKAGPNSLVKFYTSGDENFAKLGDNLYLIDEQAGNLNATLLSSHVSMPDVSKILYLPNENILLIGTATTGLYVLKDKPLKSLIYHYNNHSNSDNQVQNSLYAVSAVNDSTLLTNIGTIDIHGKNKVEHQGRFLGRIFIPLTPNDILVNTAARIYLSDQTLEPLHLLEHVPMGALNTYLMEGNTLYMGIDSFLVTSTLVNNKPTNIHQQKFKNAIITGLAKDADGMLVGTRSGFYLLHNNGKIDTIAGLEQTNITVLYKSKQNDVWIGTLGKGWYRYNKNGLTKMPVDSKGYLLRVHSFTEDANGYLWMPTNNGMFRFLYSDLQRNDLDSAGKRIFYNFFDKTYGSATSEYNGSCLPAMAKIKNGGFVFPSIQGLVLFYPSNIPVEQPNRGLLLEDIYADTTEVASENLTLKPDFNSLMMHVATPFYGNHYNLQLEYKLSDVSAKWIKVSESGNIRFNRLPSGNYHLYIRKISGYGSDNSQIVDFGFTVLPHWYRSIWFTIIWILAGAIISFLYIRHKGKIAIKRQVLLEKEVKNRTMALNTTMGLLEETVDRLTTSEAKLQQTVEQLTASEAKLKQTSDFREQVTSMVLHDIRSPLMFLDDITETVYSSSNGIVPNAFRQRLYELHASVKQIGGYAQRLLVWVNLQQEGFTTKKEPVDVLRFLQENAAHYQPLAQQKKINVTCFVLHDISFYTQPRLLEIVVRNLLDNAIKNTREGLISLSAGLEGYNLKISISDTGKGMGPTTVKRLLEDDAIVASSNTGLGYRFIHDVLKEMNGKLEIESEPGHGTTVSIVFLQMGGHIVASGSTLSLRK